MKNKKVLFTLLIIVCIAVLISIIFIAKNNNIDSNIDNNGNNTLVYKQIYKYPQKIEYIIDDNGEIKQSSIIDELTIDGTPPKANYKKVGDVSKSDLQSIKEIIDIMNIETHKKSNYSKGYGLSIFSNDALYSCVYFSQENVDKLNDIISKYIN